MRIGFTVGAGLIDEVGTEVVTRDGSRWELGWILLHRWGVGSENGPTRALLMVGGFATCSCVEIGTSMWVGLTRWGLG